jgi:hypothetical protein
MSCAWRCSKISQRRTQSLHFNLSGSVAAGAARCRMRPLHCLRLGTNQSTSDAKADCTFVITTCVYRSVMNGTYLLDVPSTGRLVFTQIVTPWFYGPLTTLASFMTDTRSSPLFIFCLHLFTFVSSKPFYSFSSHLSLGLYTFLLPSDFATLVWCILITWPKHSSFILLMSGTSSGVLYNSLVPG